MLVSALIIVGMREAFTLINVYSHVYDRGIWLMYKKLLLKQ